MIFIILKLWSTLISSMIFIGVFGLIFVDGYENKKVFEVVAALGVAGAMCSAFIGFLGIVWSIK